jgi:UDP-glucose 4-epimerase
MAKLFGGEPFEGVIHFAALKAVGESRALPLLYYDNNLCGTLSLLDAMQKAGCKTLIFSSSCTVYGEGARPPVSESTPTGSTTNAYAATKLMTEQMLQDIARADPSWRICLLRYFNPVGSHPSGRIGEDPAGIPNNLMPYVQQVAVGRRPQLTVFGSDYPTPDGTGVRDYIHVLDLADGHVAALRHLIDKPSCITVNLGTGRGHSVLELVRAFEQASGRAVPFDIAARRPGDVAACYADASLASTLLGWQSRRDLRAMCEDSWRWQSQNPNGYDS